MALGRAYVTNQSGNNLSVIDLGSMTVTAMIAVGGSPAGVAAAAHAARVYVTSPDGKFISVIDAARNKILRRISVQGGPLGIAAHPRDNRVYVADCP